MLLSLFIILYYIIIITLLSLLFSGTIDVSFYTKHVFFMLILLYKALRFYTKMFNAKLGECRIVSYWKLYALNSRLNKHYKKFQNK